MAYTLNTTLAGPSAGNPDTIIAWANGAGAKRPRDVALYVTEVYRLAALAGLRAEVVIAQAIHECSDAETGAPFASYWWVNRCNPAGMGVTGDPTQDKASPDFGNGTNAARAHVVHLYLYAVGARLPAGLDAAWDPRWAVAIANGRAGVAPTIQGLQNTWGMDNNYANALLRRLLALSTVMGGTNAPTLTFGNVPFPGYIDRQFVTANKPEGVGWDNVRLWGDAHRTPMFIVLHRMEGNLIGTDNFFGLPTTGALTDYGIGTANIDGANLDGVIYQWNDPYGYRVGWASGPVSAPYGDGLKWLNWPGNRWGVSICNVCGVSIENSGTYDNPETDFAFGELAKFVAYWFDQWEIPYNQAPIRPDTGISALTWHQEWTIGTGKICPGPWLMDHTQHLIDAAAAIMQPYQTQQRVPAPASQPAPAPALQPAPPPQYAPPSPIPELVPLTAKDKDAAKAVVSHGQSEFVWVNETVRATVDTPRLQYASADSPKVGPDLKAGETLDVLWEGKADDGQDYYVTGYWTRVRVDDTERGGDAASSPP